MGRFSLMVTTDFRRLTVWAGMLAGLLVCGGCVSYNQKVSRIERYTYRRRFKQAARIAGRAAEKRDNEQLLYYMEKGMVLHMAGKYRKSNDALFRAKELISYLDVFSVSRQTASYLTNSRALAYKGEDFEQVLVNTYLGLNFLYLGEYEDALVEFKLAALRLEEIQVKRKREYQFNRFTMYLVGLCYELEGYLEDAYVAYRRLYKIAPKLSLVRYALVDVADRLGYDDDAADWRRKFALSRQNYQALGKVVLVYQAGRAPIKVPQAKRTAMNIRHRHLQTVLPVFKKRPYRYQTAKLTVSQTGRRTVMLNSIETVSIKNLKDKYASILVRKAAGYAVKGVVSALAGKALEKRLGKSGAGRLAACLFIGLSQTERADLRCWHTLPAVLNAAVVWLKPGEYTAEVAVRSASGEKRLLSRRVSVKAGRASFINVRTFR